MEGIVFDWSLEVKEDGWMANQAPPEIEYRAGISTVITAVSKQAIQ